MCISSGKLISEALPRPGVGQFFLSSAFKELDGAQNEHLLKEIQYLAADSRLNEYGSQDIPLQSLVQVCPWGLGGQLLLHESRGLRKIRLWCKLLRGSRSSFPGQDRGNLM